MANWARTAGFILAMGSCTGSCSSSGSDGGGHPTEGGGIIAYWNADLRILPSSSGSSPMVAAAVVGLETVEVLKISPASASTTFMPATDSPGCHRTPIALDVMEYPTTGAEIEVEDVCGNYAIEGASTSEPVATSWNGGLPTNTVRYMESAVDLNGGLTLALASEDVASFFHRDPGNTSWKAVVQASLPSNLGVSMTRVVLPVVGNTWAVQGGGELDLIDVGSASDAGSPSFSAMTQAHVESPNLVKYDGYDHLTCVDSSTCPRMLFGVGVFASSGVQTPRRLVVIDLTNQIKGLYETQEFGPADFDAINVAALPRFDSGNIIIGSIGIEEGALVFKVFQMTACGLPVEIAQTAAEFNFKTPPLPAFGATVFQPRSKGAKLVALNDPSSDLVTFAHYDGYDLRLFHAQENAKTWTAWQETRRIHDTRQDLSAPAAP